MLFKFGKLLFDKIPILRPVLMKGQMMFAPKYWGMSTLYQRPDTSQSDEIFRKAFSDVSYFDRTNQHSYDDKTINGSLWRFWFVAFAVKHALKFTTCKRFVECGVGMGYTAWFAMNLAHDEFEIHLYDAWNAMKKSNLTDSEKSMTGFYHDLDLETTKNNLQKFEKNTVYHKGHIPETFDNTAPEKISYLHIDLNSSKATADALQFFIPRLVDNGVILFDEYGYTEYYETLDVVDKILIASVGGEMKGNLLKLPTGQAIYFHKSS